MTQFRFDSSHQCFVHTSGTTSRRMQGLLKRLKATFYPRYTYRDARSNSNSSPSSRRSRSRSMSSTNRGVRFESRIHTSIQISLNHNQSSMEMMNRYPIRSSLHTFWHHMNTLQLRPFEFQVPVGDVRSGIATGIDVLCRHESNEQFVVIEIKHGFEGYYHQHTRTKMKFPFHTITDSLYHQHQLQLAFTNWLFIRTYPHYRHQLMTPMIMRFNSSNRHCKLYPLRKKISQVLDLAIAQIR